MCVWLSVSILHKYKRFRLIYWKINVNNSCHRFCFCHHHMRIYFLYLCVCVCIKNISYYSFFCLSVFISPHHIQIHPHIHPSCLPPIPSKWGNQPVSQPTACQKKTIWNMFREFCKHLVHGLIRFGATRARITQRLHRICPSGNFIHSVFSLHLFFFLHAYIKITNSNIIAI